MSYDLDKCEEKSCTWLTAEEAEKLRRIVRDDAGVAEQRGWDCVTAEGLRAYQWAERMLLAIADRLTSGRPG